VTLPPLARTASPAIEWSFRCWGIGSHVVVPAVVPALDAARCGCCMIVAEPAEARAGSAGCHSRPAVQVDGSDDQSTFDLMGLGGDHHIVFHIQPDQAAVAFPKQFRQTQPIRDVDVHGWPRVEPLLFLVLESALRSRQFGQR
jgi:hypothetical protein